MDDAEVKVRAALADGELRVVPSLELHGRERLPRVEMTLEMPPGMPGSVEAWP